MTVEQVLALIDKYLPQQPLSRVQEIVFRASWQGQSYMECAQTYSYSPEYIKAVGYKLWQLLSLTFQEEVTKNNLQSVFRRQFFAESKLINSHVKSQNKEFSKNKPLKVFRQVVNEPPIFKVRHNWVEAVDLSAFYGRTKELLTLEKWIEEEHCRFIGIFGIGGIGKTTLACKLAKQIQGKFDYFWWRSLSNSPPIEDFLANLIFFLSQGQETEADLPQSVEDRIWRLINYLRSSRCLVILDNVETIFACGNHTGAYRQGYEGYGLLWRRLGELEHQSTIILTSREKPTEVEFLEGETLPVRSLKLCSFSNTEGLAIFEKKGSFSALDKEWKFIMEHYAGNPFLLKIVASVVQNVFDSRLEEFLKFWKQGTLIFDDIRELFNCQFNRLSDLEKSVMYWLAINREPVSLQELRDDLFLPQEKLMLPNVLRSLERRSLIEMTSLNFTLQPVVMECVTQNLIERVCQEIMTEEITLLVSHALIKAQIKDTVRQSQNREILSPIVEQVLILSKSYQGIECKLNQIFLKIQENFSAFPGYGITNLINISNQLNTGLSDDDLSHFIVWQSEFHDVKKVISSQSGCVKTR